ncbi:hypothetical protein SNK03_002434 [Fusarium graminearum]
MAEHIFACDDASLDPRIKHNLPLFYAAADTPNHELWCSFLTDDVVIKKGASEMKGKDGWTHSAVMAFRKVAKKEISESTDKSVHMLYKVFPFGVGALEVMLHGRTVRQSPEGVELDGADWAARMHFREIDGEVKIDLYHIYMERSLAKPQ